MLSTNCTNVSKMGKYYSLLVTIILISNFQFVFVLIWTDISGVIIVSEFWLSKTTNKLYKPRANTQFFAIEMRYCIKRLLVALIVLCMDYYWPRKALIEPNNAKLNCLQKSNKL